MALCHQKLKKHGRMVRLEYSITIKVEFEEGVLKFVSHNIPKATAHKGHIL